VPHAFLGGGAGEHVEIFFGVISTLPSGNQMWQWKFAHVFFPIKTS
jgi:hypothetical protein